MHSGVTLLFLVLFFSIIVSGSFDPLLYILAAILHEMGHLWVLRRHRKNIRFTGFGIRIVHKEILTYHAEIALALAGPAVNVLLSAVFAVVHQVCSTETVRAFLLANIMYALINLIPLSPLDGYKILKNTAYRFLPLNKANVMIKIVNLIWSALLLIVLIKCYCNISFVVVTLVLLISCFA